MSENSAPRVSVLMSVYNGEAYVREAVDSILNQTFTGFEFVVIDDASNDSTAAILDSYDDPRFVRVRNRVNIGLTKSLNKGLQIARGVFIARQDADDISFPERLATQVNYFDSNPHIGLLGTAYYKITVHGECITTVNPPLSDTEIRWQGLFQNPFCHTSVMLRRERLRNEQYNEDLPFTQDYDLWMRLLKNTRAANLSTVLVALRTHDKSVTTMHYEKQRRIATTIAAREMFALAEGVSIKQSDVNMLQRWYSNFPEGLSLEDMRLCCSSLDILNVFCRKMRNEPNILRKIRHQWTENILASIHPGDFSAMYSSGLLGRVLREHTMHILAHGSKRVLRRVSNQLAPKKGSLVVGTRRND
jgi:glycosyltransferase involved in cell wall biosynthesis